MIRFLIRLLIYFLAALFGLWVADIVLGDNFSISGGLTYLYVAGIFAILQAILSPLIDKMVSKNASAFTGGVGLISAFVALFITNLVFSSGLQVSGGLTTWILATLLIWLAGAIAAFVLPFFLVKKVVDDRRG